MFRAGFLTLALVAPAAAQRPEATPGEPDRGPRQLPAETYARAEKLLGPNLVGLVLNPYVVPHWVAGSDEFWYDRELRGGHQFVRVSAATGRKQPAFDHQAVAQALASERLTVSASDLPFHEFEYGADARTIAFEIGDER